MLWRERERQTETETETETDRQTEIERQRERVCVSCSCVMFFVLDVCFQVCVWKGEWALMSNFFSLYRSTHTFHPKTLPPLRPDSASKAEAWCANRIGVFAENS